MSSADSASENFWADHEAMETSVQRLDLCNDVQYNPTHLTTPSPTPTASNDLNLEMTNFLRHDFFTSVPFHWDENTDDYFEDFWVIAWFKFDQIMHVTT